MPTKVPILMVFSLGKCSWYSRMLIEKNTAFLATVTRQLKQGEAWQLKITVKFQKLSRERGSSFLSIHIFEA